MSSEPSALTGKTGTPCRGGIPPLSKAGVEGHHRQTPEWGVRDAARRIERTFRFKNFAEAFEFVKRAGDLAEEVIADEHARVTTRGSDRLPIQSALSPAEAYERA